MLSAIASRVGRSNRATHTIPESNIDPESQWLEGEMSFGDNVWYIYLHEELISRYLSGKSR